MKGSSQAQRLMGMKPWRKKRCASSCSKHLRGLKIILQIVLLGWSDKGRFWDRVSQG